MIQGRVCLILKNRKGFTLIEIMAVMVIISVLAGVGVRKFDEISGSASAKALEQGLSELNSRELLTWALVKFSDQDWVTDEALFAQIDKKHGSRLPMGVGACHNRGFASHDIRVDNFNKDSLDRQFGREMGGQLNQAAR